MDELVVDDPYTLEEAVRVAYATDAEVDGALDAARAAAKDARRTPLSERLALCRRALDHMSSHGEAIAADITRMMGKPLGQARGELRGMVQRAEHMMSIAESSLSDTVLSDAVPGGRPGFERRIAREPLGVVFSLPAWNYPLLTAVNVVIPAVLAGNTVLLKHSPRSPRCGDHFADAFRAAGAPAGLVQALQCTHPVSERIARDPRVDFVAFTGSGYGGRRIYASAASERFIDVGLELGGKDAAYVAPDADLEAAVAGIVDGACYNAGQSCCAVERAYVHADLYDGFVERALALVKAYVLGDPTADGTTLGPMAQPDAPDKLARHVEEARGRGARVLTGGRRARAQGTGRFFEATLVVDVPPDTLIMREESFGPLLPVVRVGSDEEALALMNDSDLGLTASVWTHDVERARRLARELEVGTVYMNQCDTLDPALPWTGVKGSGKGSTLSALGYLHLTRPKAISFKLPTA